MNTIQLPVAVTKIIEQNNRATKALASIQPACKLLGNINNLVPARHATAVAALHNPIKAALRFADQARPTLKF
jgi:hypothetical protein